MNLFLHIRRKHPASFLMLLVMLAAFAAKAVLPAGFMPTVDKNGFTQIVICSGMGQKTIMVPADESPASDHQDKPAGEMCAYQILASGKEILPLPVSFDFVPVVSPGVIERAGDQTSDTSFSLSFTARGPPSV